MPRHLKAPRGCQGGHARPATLWLWTTRDGLRAHRQGARGAIRGFERSGYNPQVLHGARRTPAAVPAAGASKTMAFRLRQATSKEKT